MLVFSRLISLFLLLGLTWGLQASGAAIDFADKTPEQTRELVQNALQKIGAGYSENQQNTRGFQYRFNSNLVQPWHFHIYIASFDNRNTLVNIDAPGKMNYALADVLLQEAGQGPFEKTYPSRSVILADLLTIVHPAAGIFYTYHNSPFAATPPWLQSLIFLGVDTALLAMGGTTFFTHSFNPLGTGMAATAILLGGHRLGHLFMNHLSVVGSNRLIGLKYTFRF